MLAVGVRDDGQREILNPAVMWRHFPAIRLRRTRPRDHFGSSGWGPALRASGKIRQRRGQLGGAENLMEAAGHWKPRMERWPRNTITPAWPPAHGR
jgi:hypothetical protein